MASEEKEMNTTTLQEENAQLRKQLAATQEQLRLVIKENVPPEQTKKWNYREWIQGNQEHELVPQEEEEEEDVEMIDTATMTKTQGAAAAGLHRRHTDPMSSNNTAETDVDVHDTPRLPMTLKAKLSDIEAQGSPRSKSSDNSEESFLSHSPLDLDDDDCAAAGGLVRTTPNNIEDEPFLKSIADRAGWLVGLLILQSCSSFILSSNQALLQSHIVLVQFLTMLVGAGGNAGNQASVRVIRGLAVGSVRNDNVKSFLWSELRMGVCLSLILGVVGCIRAALFLVPMAETVAITASLLLIVFISIVIGATLPLLMHYVNIDPAHSSTTIQVLMDILGVTITVVVSSLILNSNLGRIMSPDLYGDSNDVDSL